MYSSETLQFVLNLTGLNLKFTKGLMNLGNFNKSLVFLTKKRVNSFGIEKEEWKM